MFWSLFLFLGLDPKEIIREVQRFSLQHSSNSKKPGKQPICPIRGKHWNKLIWNGIVDYKVYAKVASF